jgi:hypothetical protein
MCGNLILEQYTPLKQRYSLSYADLFMHLIPMLMDENTTLDDKKAELGGFTEVCSLVSLEAIANVFHLCRNWINSLAKQATKPRDFWISVNVF